MSWGRRRGRDIFGVFCANRRGARCRSRMTSTNPFARLSKIHDDRCNRDGPGQSARGRYRAWAGTSSVEKLGSDEQALFELRERWRNEAVLVGRTISCCGCLLGRARRLWLVRWLRRATSRPTLSTRIVSRSAGATAGENHQARHRAPEACLLGWLWGARRVISVWLRSGRLRKRTLGELSASVRTWWVSAPASGSG